MIVEALSRELPPKLMRSIDVPIHLQTLARQLPCTELAIPPSYVAYVFSISHIYSQAGRSGTHRIIGSIGSIPLGNEGTGGAFSSLRRPCSGGAVATL